MADEIVSLEIDVEAAESANSIGELKRAIKELESAAIAAGNAGDEALAKKYQAAAAAARDKVSDFRKEVAALQDTGSKLGSLAQIGSTIAGGFQAAQGAAALFGAEGKNIEQVMLKVQAATALAQGAQALANLTEDIAIAKKVAYTTVTNIANAAVKAFGLSAQAAMAAATAGITLLVGAVIGLIAYLDSAKKKSEELEAQEKKRKEQAAASAKYANDYQLKLIENEIKLAEARGETDKALELKKKLIQRKIDLINEELNAYETSVERSRELTLLKMDLDTELTLLQESNNKKRVQDVKTTKEKIEKIQAEKPKKVEEVNFDELRKKEYEQALKLSQEYFDKQKLQASKQYADGLITKQQYEDELQRIQKQSLENQLIIQQDYLESTIQTEQQLADIRIKERQKLEEEMVKQDEIERNREVALQQFKIDTVRGGIQALSELASAAAGRSEAAQRRAFNINKAANIAITAIDTFMAAQKAYNSQMPPPGVPDPSAPVRGAIAAGIAIASGLARVMAIARTQFGSTTAPSVSGGGGGSISSGGATAASASLPLITGGVPRGTTPITNLSGETTKQEPIKVYVLENDISKSQARVSSIMNRAVVN
jgi:hypothetical protein